MCMYISILYYMILYYRICYIVYTIYYMVYVYEYICGAHAVEVQGSGFSGSVGGGGGGVGGGAVVFRFELWTVVHSVASRTPSVLEASSVEGTVAGCDHTGFAHGLWQRERRKRGKRGTFCAEIFARASIAWPQSHLPSFRVLLWEEP